ncbi:hypothetical protein RCL_jg5858.t1 [Rhizophagus clarus]|uniref:Uncharacterized protein n=1 Tax=Rhizophagus clarus TaxID=94130 RepID=A0A8H3M0I2_9GLOM|nr:hypothetical protein RCL_jg5858.t1 [Rhizophagus clarus]
MSSSSQTNEKALLIEGFYEMFKAAFFEIIGDHSVINSTIKNTVYDKTERAELFTSNRFQSPYLQKNVKRSATAKAELWLVAYIAGLMDKTFQIFRDGMRDQIDQQEK